MDPLIKSFLDSFPQTLSPEDHQASQEDYLELVYDYCWEWGLGFNDEIAEYALTLRGTECS
jgi:hypothetical protein